MNRERTDWTGVAFGTCLACLVAFQQFKLPPVLSVLLADYHWDRTLAGGLMAIYALAGLLLSIPPWQCAPAARNLRGAAWPVFGCSSLAASAVP